MGTIKQIADAKEDYEGWKEARRDLITSSEIFTWVGNVPSWWGDRREDVLAGKEPGAPDKEFPLETATSIAHGAFDEESIMAKLGHAVGCQVLPHNGLFTNSRWPFIGASIDGYLRPWDYDAWHEPNLECPEVHPEFSQDRTLMPYLRSYIDAAGDEALLEIKKSTSQKWKTETPEYYVTQIQTQMAVLEIDYCVIAAECIHRGEQQKWRNYFDMRAYVHERDPKWEKHLDRINREFALTRD